MLKIPIFEIPSYFIDQLENPVWEIEKKEEKKDRSERKFRKSSRLIKRLKKNIEDIYKDFIDLLIHAEETKSSCKKLVYDLERRINGLKISINDHFDDLRISEDQTKSENRNSHASAVSDNNHNSSNKPW